jgi:hypothetical protein
MTVSVRIGDYVDYRSSPRAVPKRTRVMSEPWVLGGHTWVAMVEGVRGCVALSAISPVSDARPSSWNCGECRSAGKTHCDCSSGTGGLRR